MLERILTAINNWFPVEGGIHSGTYTVKDGSIALPFLQNGQYFRIVGSVFNDGLHRYGPDMEALTDETFDGTIWALAIPKAVIDAAREAEAWFAKNGAVADSPFSSESFGGYAYAKDNTAAQSVASSGLPASIRARLKPYQRIGGI